MNVLKKVLGLSAVSLVASFNAYADLQCRVPSDNAMSAVVRIVGDGVEGSGVVIAKNRVLTAAHVIDDLDRIEILRGGIKYTANVIAVMPEKDMALLLVDTGRQTPLKVSRTRFEPESRVWAVGYPLGGNEVATSGRVTSYRGFDVQTTASVNHGQSGGGLLACDQGRFVLAGMVRAFGATQEGNKLIRLDNYSVSVNSDEIRNFVVGSASSAKVLEEFIYGATPDTVASNSLLAQR